MANCEWKTDSDSGAETLFVDGVEKIRISDAANKKVPILPPPTNWRFY